MPLYPDEGFVGCGVEIEDDYPLNGFVLIGLVASIRKRDLNLPISAVIMCVNCKAQETVSTNKEFVDWLSGNTVCECEKREDDKEQND